MLRLGFVYDSRTSLCILVILCGLSLLPRQRQMTVEHDGRARFSLFPQTNQAVDNFTWLRSQCRWSLGVLSHHHFGYTHFTHAEWQRETLVEGLRGLNDSHADMKLLRCSMVLNDTDIMTIDRVGPFFSAGGNDWHRWMWDNVGGLSSRLESQSLVKMAILAVGVDGEVIPMPPLHPHHWHLNTPIGPYRPWSSPAIGLRQTLRNGQKVGHLIAQTHGDSQCNSQGRNDGVSCYFQIAAPGEGYPLISNDVTAFGETNDVRSEASPPLEHYLEVFLIATSRIVRPYRIDGVNGSPYFQEVEFLKTITHKIPSQGQSLYWREKKFRLCAHASSLWWHTHHRMTRDMWFVKGSVQDIGLHLLPKLHNGEALILSEVGTTLNDIQASISARLQENRNTKLVCSLAPPFQRFEYVSAMFIGVNGAHYARNVMTCPDIKIEANDTYTLVAFYEHTFSDPPQSLWFRQHCAILWKASGCSG